jgi:hypothetical protein
MNVQVKKAASLIIKAKVIFNTGVAFSGRSQHKFNIVFCQNASQQNRLGSIHE